MPATNINITCDNCSQRSCVEANDDDHYTCPSCNAPARVPFDNLECVNADVHRAPAGQADQLRLLFTDTSASEDYITVLISPARTQSAAKLAEWLRNREPMLSCLRETVAPLRSAGWSTLADQACTFVLLGRGEKVGSIARSQAIESLKKIRDQLDPSAAEALDAAMAKVAQIPVAE